MSELPSIQKSDCELRNLLLWYTVLRFIITITGFQVTMAGNCQTLTCCMNVRSVVGHEWASSFLFLYHVCSVIDKIVTWKPKETAIAGHRQPKHVSTATNTHVLNNESARGSHELLSSEGFKSCQTVKYGHESSETRNKYWLCWWGPAAV
jgi:hypothetical protein